MPGSHLTHDSNNFLLVRRLTLISVNTLRSSLNFDIVLDIRCSVKHPFSSVVITCPRYVNFLTFSITCSPMLNSVDFSEPECFTKRVHRRSYRGSWIKNSYRGSRSTFRTIRERIQLSTRLFLLCRCKKGKHFRPILSPHF